MGTAKRERQKANRQARLEELAKQAKKDKSKRIGVRVAIVVVAIVAIVAALNIFKSDGGGETTGDTTIPAGSTPLESTTTVSYPPMEKPTVSIPATIPTELQVTTLKEGSGPAAAEGDTVTVHYIGVLSADGTEFDNSYDRGDPLVVTIGTTSLIPGFTQGLIGVQAGGQYQLDIPGDLAYGDNPPGDPIKAGDALTFVIDVLSVVPATPVDTTPTT